MTMTIEEIKQAIAEGKHVKYLNSNYTVDISDKGIVFAQYAITGKKKELSVDDLDDCFH